MALSKRNTYGGAALALLAVLFIGLIMLSSFALRGMRIDLTENNQYTLAPGTLRIIKSIKEPVNLYFYFSRSAGEQAPYLKIYATRVRELLEELSARAKGKIRLQIIDPEPFSEDEDRANEFGLQPVPLGASGESMYFGLAGTNSTDGKAIIQIFQPDKEEFLEYDVAKLILQLTTPKKPTLALLNSLPMEMDFNPQTGQRRDAWAIYSQLQQLFTVKTIAEGAEKIDEDVDVLIVVHPKNVSDKTQFAIEQYLMRGGHALVFVDPRAEADPAGQPDQLYGRGDPYAAMMAPRDSSLPKLFKAWGIEFDTKQVTGDLEHALMVSSQARGQPVRHLGFMGIGEDALNRKDVVTGSINSVNFATAGSFRLAKNSTLKLEPLIQTGTQAGQIPAERFMMMSDPTALRDNFKPSGERKVIAARLTGAIKTAFPEGPPGGAPAAAADNTPGNGGGAAQPAVLKESKKPVNLILVGDTDVLTDMLWVRKQSFFGQTMAQAFASNGDFVLNAVDNLAGSSDLISIRGRATFVRPFSRVEEIKRQAEDRFRAKEKELEEELRGTEQKLTELQSSRKDANSSFILSPEQEQELKRFQEQKLRIRKELRDVRHGMDKDIESLGRTIRILNIGFVPFVLSGLALAAVAWRRRRARRH